MLVLSRKQSESLQIDAEIQITVISIGKGRVKLGISAPDHVRITRNELIGRRPDAAVTREAIWPQPTKML
jgi:carbon storage regulator CsrA